MEVYLSTAEVAERLGISPKTVVRYIQAERLPGFQLPGGDYRVPASAVDALVPPPPAPPALARTLAVVHHAGGVGKTTTTLNLGYALAAAGQRVLLVDLDPQGDLSRRVGRAPIPPTLGTALTYGETTPAVQTCTWERKKGGPPVSMDLIAGDLEDMYTVELALVPVQERERRLARALGPLRARYDWVLADCPPSLTLLTVNALFAAEGVLVPVQAEDKALSQLNAVWRTISDVQKSRPELRLFGILATMVTETNNARDVVAALMATYPDLMFQSSIPRRTQATADSRWHAPVGSYAPADDSALAYAALAQEVLTRA